jgi:regulator of sigma E protease
VGTLDYVLAAVALCVVIILHELGHYLTAVWSGMKVDRFSVFGIGPAIVRLGTWRGTEFVIGAIPFGAYVLIRGMEADENEKPRRASEPDPDSPNFRDKPLSRRALVIAGGPIANYITAIVLFFVAVAFFGISGPPDTLYVRGFADDSPAEAAGMMEGDELVQVGETTVDPPQRGADLTPAAEPYRGKAMPVVVQRDGELVTLSIDVPSDPEERALGITARTRGPRFAVDLGTAASAGISEPFVQSAAQLVGLYDLATGKTKGAISGPVGIVEEFAGKVAEGVPDFIEMTALISALLGLFNLLPLPALDGGRLTFLGYEALVRRRANPRVEEMVHGYGMLALLALLVYVTFDDIRRIL